MTFAILMGGSTLLYWYIQNFSWSFRKSFNYQIMPAIDDGKSEGGEAPPAEEEVKEYQTLFWVPMLFQTAKNVEGLIDEMLDMIQDFHDSNAPTVIRRQSLRRNNGAPRRRQQILGEVLDSEAAITRVDVVMKSESTKFNLLTVLKRHFLFSQLRDYELEDVIDVMQAQYSGEGEVIIQQGDTGELFYILEEGEVKMLDWINKFIQETIFFLFDYRPMRNSY